VVTDGSGSVAQLAEYRNSNRKVAKSWFDCDSQCGSPSLYQWKRNVLPILGPISLPDLVVQR